MPRHKKEFTSLQAHATYRIRALLGNFHKDVKREKWNVNYNREITPQAAHSMIVNWIQQYGVVLEECFGVYWSSMIYYVDNCSKIKFSQNDILKQVLRDEKTKRWYEIYHKKEKVLPIKKQSPEEIVAEAIGRLKTGQRFLR